MFMYILLILLLVIPPVIVAIYGKPLEVLLNLVLTAFGIIPGVVHAVFVYIDRREKKENIFSNDK